MSVYCTGVAIVQHADTGKIYTIESEELDWQSNGTGDERAMGLEVHHIATIEHPQLGELTWTVAEYPVGAENDKETNVGPHKLLQNFSFGLGAAPDDVGIDELEDLKVAEMVEWFHENYEDPAERTPYESREGGYQWIWGGPHDAREVLEAEFPGVADELIERAVAEVESEGILEWAPTERPGDYDDSDIPKADVDEILREMIAAVPDQRLGISFEVSKADRIGLATRAATETLSVQIEGVVAEARLAITELCNRLSGSNAHSDLLGIAKRYATHLTSDPPPIGALYAAGVRLENASHQLKAQISQGELPELPGLSAETLQTVLDLHGVIIGATTTGRELLDSAARYAQPNAEIRKLREVSEQIAGAVAAAKEIFDSDAVDAITTIAQEIGRGPFPERSTEVAVTGISNLFKVALAVSSIAIAAVVGEGIVASIPGVVLSEGVTTLSNATWAFLVEYLPIIQHFAAVVGPDLSWLKASCDMIEHRKARSRFQ